ncbi:hypothetical protein AX016_3363 [Cellulophaga sp. RHA19]|uniref:DUF2059 domain-containing protein n=1 Tax=Cellulophaga sp. RHA19 TaxID=1798237 RepID=UPI000C2C4A65|nr:DUF2059 domain-containing protein [Cellulophaga sp. RHA19]PKB45125.1 hypothetical protein AX016_3363 [Cellulophaga sp. RHA19]
MKQLGIALVLVLFFATNGIAQTKKDTSLINTYLKANGSAAQYEYAYDQLLTMLHKNHPKTAANTDAYKYLNDNKSKAVGEILDSLGVVYTKHFTKDDIKEMLGFYRGEAAKQMLKDRTKMTEEQKQQLNAYYNSEVGKKIISKQQVLSKEIGSASEAWSRDLYETAMSLLK